MNYPDIKANLWATISCEILIKPFSHLDELKPEDKRPYYLISICLHIRLTFFGAKSRTHRQYWNIHRWSEQLNIKKVYYKSHNRKLLWPHESILNNVFSDKLPTRSSSIYMHILSLYAYN